MPSLYEITESYREVFALLEESEGEWTPEIASRMEALDGEYDQKIQNIALFILDLEAEKKKIKDEISRLSTRVITTQNKIEALSKYVLSSLEFTGRKVKTHLVSVWAQNSPPSVVVDDLAVLPDFFKTATVKTSLERIPESLRELATIEPCKTAIKEAIDNGEEVPGVHLEWRKHLRIK